jgi:hypothetical protein
LTSAKASADLYQLFQETHALQVEITAIIQTVDGNKTYWALAHPGLQKDYHLRESFILEL